MANFYPVKQISKSAIVATLRNSVDLTEDGVSVLSSLTDSQLEKLVWKLAQINNAVNNDSTDYNALEEAFTPPVSDEDQLQDQRDAVRKKYALRRERTSRALQRLKR